MPAEVATSPELHAIKNLKQIAREEYIAPGTAVCGGCGGLEALRLAAKVLGPCGPMRGAWWSPISPSSCWPIPRRSRT